MPLILRFSFLWLSALCLLGAEEGTSPWKLALPGWRYEFPRDHYSHEGFKTEWWYFTGNLQTDAGREFGYQLTFFRQGVVPDRPASGRSRFLVRDLSLAHFAITDVTAGEYHHLQQLKRGSFGQAGFSDRNRIAWVGAWRLLYDGPGRFRLEARDEDMALDLTLTAEKPPVFHGENGVSQKSAGEGRASHYYSFTRLKTEGSLRLGDKQHQVTGLSWYDHEWATNQLTEDQEGWDWFSLQFESGEELMLFQIRTRDGGRDPFSSGSWVRQDGSVLGIGVKDFTLEPLRWWQSRATPGRYPVEWRLKIPQLELDLTIKARLDAQEFVEQPISYWEGSISGLGTLEKKPLAGTGYLEMTGYGSPIVGMQQALPTDQP